MIRCCNGGQARLPSFSKVHIALPLVLAGILIGCSEEKPEDQNSTRNTSSSPIPMPPAIVASHSYRCSDGQVVYVDFLQDDLSINLRKASTGPTFRLSAYAQGVAYVGDDGTNVTLNGKDLELEEPKRKPTTCKRA